MKLILASNSAARRQMLANAGFRFEPVVANIDERSLKTAYLASGLPATGLAPVLADAKAHAVGAVHPDDLVVGSDQVLICDGKVFTKPGDLAQAARQLAALQGRTHTLISAVACRHQDQQVFQTSEAAKMTMFRLTAEEIDAYLLAAGASVLGSVGCYQIEGKGIRLFENIEGSHYTIMGMPLLPLVKFLNRQSNLQ